MTAVQGGGGCRLGGPLAERGNTFAGKNEAEGGVGENRVGVKKANFLEKKRASLVIDAKTGPPRVQTEGKGKIGLFAKRGGGKLIKATIKNGGGKKTSISQPRPKKEREGAIQTLGREGKKSHLKFSRLERPSKFSAPKQSGKRGGENGFRNTSTKEKTRKVIPLRKKRKEFFPLVFL